MNRLCPIDQEKCLQELCYWWRDDKCTISNADLAEIGIKPKEV